MSDNHNAAKTTAGVADLATCFLGVGTPEDPNKIRPANIEDWKRSAKHPIHPVERPAGQTKKAKFAANWFDGVRVVIIWARWCSWRSTFCWRSSVTNPTITRLLVIHPPTAEGRMVQIFDEDWFRAMRDAERKARRAREGPRAQAD